MSSRVIQVGTGSTLPMSSAPAVWVLIPPPLWLMPRPQPSLAQFVDYGRQRLSLVRWRRSAISHYSCPIAADGRANRKGWLRTTAERAKLMLHAVIFENSRIRLSVPRFKQQFRVCAYCGLCSDPIALKRSARFPPCLNENLSWLTTRRGSCRVRLRLSPFRFALRPQQWGCPANMFLPGQQALRHL